MTKDELKALWAELGENHFNHRIGDYANEIPPGPPRPGLDETDWKAPRVHAMLETHIRGEKKPLLGNMRAFPPRGTINEVWNQGIYKYIAEYKAIPGRGPRAVKIKIELHANSGSMLNGQDDKDRVINYEYSLVYGLDGKVDETNPGRGRLDLGGWRSPLRPAQHPRGRRIALGGPQSLRDRGQRPGARPGQRRRRRPVRLGPAAVPPGRPVRRSPLGGQQSLDVRQRQRQLGPASRRLLPDPLRPLSPAPTLGTRPAPLHQSCVRLPRPSPDPAADQTPRRDRAFSLVPGMAVTRHWCFSGQDHLAVRPRHDGRDSPKALPPSFPVSLFSSSLFKSAGSSVDQ